MLTYLGRSVIWTLQITGPQGCTACAVRQLDMLHWKDEKPTNRPNCSTASTLPSPDCISCRRTDRELVPVTVLSSRRPEAMSSTLSCAVGELHKMVNYFVNDHFWWVISSALYLMWKPSFNDACGVCNNIECVKINTDLITHLAGVKPVLQITWRSVFCVCKQVMTKTLWVLCALTNSQFQTYCGATHYQKAVLAVANTLRWAINPLSCLNWLWPILYRQSFGIVTYLWTLRMKDYVLNIALAWTVLNNFVQSKPTPFSPIHLPICLSNWVFLRILCKTLFYRKHIG